MPICTGTGPNEALCVTTVIDHFTTSFNWAQKNFAAVWLRGWWYLLRDSAITDVQGGGLTFVTGGGYTRSDAAQGFWNLSQRVLFVGNTQPIENGEKMPLNPYASNAGPFNPYGLSCPPNSTYCVSKANDISMQVDAFGGAQRMISIYDGPSFEDSDAFMDVHTIDIGTLSQCKSGDGTSRFRYRCPAQRAWAGEPNAATKSELQRDHRKSRSGVNERSGRSESRTTAALQRTSVLRHFCPPLDDNPWSAEAPQD